jgi:hypothetical protein
VIGGALRESPFGGMTGSARSRCKCLTVNHPAGIPQPSRTRSASAPSIRHAARRTTSAPWRYHCSGGQRGSMVDDLVGQWVRERPGYMGLESVRGDSVLANLLTSR